MNRSSPVSGSSMFLKRSVIIRIRCSFVHAIAPPLSVTYSGTIFFFFFVLLS